MYVQAHTHSKVSFPKSQTPARLLPTQGACSNGPDSFKLLLRCRTLRYVLLVASVNSQKKDPSTHGENIVDHGENPLLKIIARLVKFIIVCRFVFSQARTPTYWEGGEGVVQALARFSFAGRDPKR